MSAQPVRWYTHDAYFALEEASADKHEYCRGEVFAMAGGTPEHSRVTVNAVRLLDEVTEGGPWLVYESNVRVRVEAYDLYTYPDVSLTCEEPDFDRRGGGTLRNPTLLVEVLSESTKAYDRGTKAEMYRTIPSLKAYLLLAQDRAHVELYTRREDGQGWTFTEATGRDAKLHVPTLGVDLPLARLYNRVNLPEDDAPRRESPPPHAQPG